MVECLPKMHEALGSILSTIQSTKKKKRQGRERKEKEKDLC